MNQIDFKNEREVKEPRAKVSRLRWFIWLCLVVGGVAGAFISTKLLLLVLFIACIVLYSHLSDHLRWRILNPMSFKDRSRRKGHDDDA